MSDSYNCRNQPSKCQYKNKRRLVRVIDIIIHLVVFWFPFIERYTLYIYIYIYIYIIIIMWRSQNGYPWPSLATSPYHSSPLAGLQGYILCPHIVAVCKFELVVLLLHGHMWGSIGVHHLMSSSLLRQQCPACLVRLTCIVFVMGGGKCPYSWCLVGCCCQDLFNTALNILV